MAAATTAVTLGLAAAGAAGQAVSAHKQAMTARRAETRAKNIARAENGKKQRYLLFSYGFPNYLETEEGLAVYNEKINDLLPNHILKHYAGRVIAVDLALKNSFSIVYNELLQYFNKDIAWNLALRAKRGLADTSKKGGFSKDYLYLKGKYVVEDFVKKGGDVKELYVGKIGVEHVPLMKEIL